MGFYVRTAVVAVCVLATSCWAGAAVDGVDLTMRGHTSLPSLGHDGMTKARGQNGDVALLGDYAFVSGGSKNHGALATPGRICTDYGGVKVVNLANPDAPTVVDQIDIADTKNILTGPKGNPRRGANVKNVSSTASSVDVFHNPVANKDILAITTERCEQSFFDGARIEFWDVTNPNNIPATPIGVMDPQDIINPACIPGPCPPSTPADGRWGIFEDIRMFSRNNGPGGTTKVYAIATSPFSIGNTGGVSFVGDFRLIDVTDPANPTQLTSFPNSPIGESTNNGCRTFQAARSAAPTPDGSGAIVSYYDGAAPPGAPSPNTVQTLRTQFGSTNSAALFRFGLDSIPTIQTGVGTDVDPKIFAPNPAVFGYPPATDGGETPAGQVEGNAADVQVFSGPNGEILAIVSEEDNDPALTQLTIDAPASAAHTSRGCAMLGDFTKIYNRPAQALSADVAYIGRGCPSSPLVNSALTAADPYLADPNGKIALIESGGDGFNGCSLARKMQRAFSAGAVGVMTNLGGATLSVANIGPDGGAPDIPSIGIKAAGFNKMAGFLPNRVMGWAAAASATALPAAWELLPGSAATNATVKPIVAALGCAAPVGGTAPTAENCVAATNETPIKIRTTHAHGLATGDRVTIAGVAGNTAANGTFTVTVPASTTPPEAPAITVFTLDGSAGSGAYTGGGRVAQCPPNTPNCSIPATARADFSRFRSVANATDRVAGVHVKVANLGAVTPGESYRAGAVLEVAERVDGAYEAAIEWFSAADAPLGESVIQSVAAVTPRRANNATVVAPAGATKAGIRFRWTGAAAEGTAYADSPNLVPSGLHVTLKDNQGVWGEQKIVDMSANPPVLKGAYRSPTSKVWPPPNNGVFMPREARMLDSDLVFSTWMSDGLRVLDVSDPSDPKEVASLVPPAVADPSPAAGSGPSNTGAGLMSRGASYPTRTLVTGVAVRKLSATTARVVLSDINAGLYVVDVVVRRPVVTPPPPPVAPPPPPPAGPPGATPADTKAPTLTGLSLTPASFKAASSGRSVGSRGTRVSYRVSEAGTTTFTVERVSQGRRRGSSCQRPSSSNRGGRACTRYVKVSGSFTHKGATGKVNRFTFTGRLSGRKLAAGRYRLNARPADAAGNRGTTKRAPFRIRR
jgi:hypothetical protein